LSIVKLKKQWYVESAAVTAAAGVVPAAICMSHWKENPAEGVAVSIDSSLGYQFVTLHVRPCMLNGSISSSRKNAAGTVAVTELASVKERRITKSSTSLETR